MATSAASVSLVSKCGETAAEEMSCGFCLQKLIYMEDPRVLPCHHVFCLPCLQGDLARLNLVQCGFCSKDFGQLNLDALPTIKAESSGDQMEETIRSDVPLCDVCTDNPAPTDKYCRDCGVKLCVDHFKIHEAMLKGSHEILSLERFQKMLGQDMRRETCDTHKGKNLRLACKICSQIFCQYCDMLSNCRQADIKDAKKPRIAHTIQSLDTLAEEHRSTMGSMLKMLSQKISGMAQTEKQCWKVLDDVEEKAKLTLADVDRITAEQIERVKRKSEELKQEIEDYLTECTEKMEKHISGLVEQREQLDSTWSALISKLNQYSDTEFLRSYQTALDNLNATEDIELSVFKPDDIELSSIGNDEPLGIRITKISSHPKPPYAISGPVYTIHDWSYSVDWKKDGTLASNEGEYVISYTEKMRISSSAEFEYPVGGCIREYKDGYLLMFEDVDDVALEHYSADLKKIKTLEDSNHTVYNDISVNDIVIVAVEGIRNQLAVYDAETLKREYSIKLVDYDNPKGVCIYNKDTVLVSDNRRNKISLYQLKKDGKHIWTCEGLTGAKGICIDKYGFIYVACQEKVMVIAKDGEVQATLVHHTMKDPDFMSHDISIIGDKVALSGGGVGILIFNVQR